MKNEAVIMDCDFFPSWEWFCAFKKAPNVIIEQHEHFVRTSYRNRTYVAGPNGVICLSVPLDKGRNQRTIMKDVKISNEEDWQSLHWKTIATCYRRSAYFEYFEDILRPFYEQKFDYLMDANLASLDIILNLLQIKKEYQLSTEFQPEATNDKRNTFLPKNRLTAEQPEYIQPFSDRNGFEKNLSMLDYLFCCGRWD